MLNAKEEKKSHNFANLFLVYLLKSIIIYLILMIWLFLLERWTFLSYEGKPQLLKIKHHRAIIL